MALVLKDRVKETSLSTGTSSFVLGGAYPGYQSFANCIPTGSTVYYCIHNTDNAYQDEWEVGIGTYTLSTTTLSRDTVLSSSNSNSIVTFNTGTKEVFITYPAERSVYQDSTGTDVVQNVFASLTSGSIALTTGTITTPPSSGTDIANKSYVDTVATGLHVHTPVRLESPDTAGNLTATYVNGGTTPTWTTITTNNTLTTGSAHSLSLNDIIVFGSTTNGLTAGTPYFVKSIPSSTSITLSLTYDGAEITSLTNGTGLSITSRANSGVGATLTNAGTKAALVIDGVTVSAGNRILIYNQTNAYENGIYTVTTVGTPDPGGTNWVLTRATDANTYSPVGSSNSLGDGDYWYVTEGDTGKGESYVFNTSGTIVFGTTNLSFVQFSSAQVYSAGTGLTLSSTTFSITNTAVSPNTYGSASAVGTFTVNQQGQLTNAATTSISINGNQITSGYVGVGYGGTGQTTYTTGDLIYASGSTALSKLGIGSTGQYLTVSGGLPAWGTLSDGAVTTFSGGTTGLLPSSATSGAITLSGALNVANGGTGATSYTDGQLLIGNSTGNTLTKSTITAGSGISVTNGSGSITIASTITGATITNDTSTATPVYPVFAGSTSGSLSTAYISNANLLYTPSTGLLSAKQINASGNVFTNGNTFSSDYTFTSSYNSLSIGPMTVDAGVTLTVDAGANWVVL